MAAQGRPDRGGQDLDAQPVELALDALVAPARVLSGKADDQLLDVLIERWTPTPAAGIGPGVGDQAAVPAQHGLGGDQEAGPVGSWQHAADRGEHGSIGRLQPRSMDLAAQHGELMAQHQDLEVLGGVAAGEQCEQLDGAAQGQVGESGQHAK
jgi:hypothetical protein